MARRDAFAKSVFIPVTNHSSDFRQGGAKSSLSAVFGAGRAQRKRGGKMLGSARTRREGTGRSFKRRHGFRAQQRAPLRRRPARGGRRVRCSGTAAARGRGGAEAARERTRGRRCGSAPPRSEGESLARCDARGAVQPGISRADSLPGTLVIAYVDALRVVAAGDHGGLALHTCPRTVAPHRGVHDGTA